MTFSGAAAFLTMEEVKLMRLGEVLLLLLRQVRICITSTDLIENPIASLLVGAEASRAGAEASRVGEVVLVTLKPCK